MAIASPRIVPSPRRPDRISSSRASHLELLRSDATPLGKTFAARVSERSDIRRRVVVPHPSLDKRRDMAVGVSAAFVRASGVGWQRAIRASRVTLGRRRRCRGGAPRSTRADPGLRVECARRQPPDGREDRTRQGKIEHRSAAYPLPDLWRCLQGNGSTSRPAVFGLAENLLSAPSRPPHAHSAKATYPRGRLQSASPLNGLSACSLFWEAAGSRSNCVYSTFRTAVNRGETAGGATDRPPDRLLVRQITVSGTPACLPASWIRQPCAPPC